MRETEQAAASMIRRQPSALSSLFAHLVGLAAKNPVREIAGLAVGDLHRNRGFGPLRVSRKGAPQYASRSLRRPLRGFVPI
jgi:hypothetical protein